MVSDVTDQKGAELRNQLQTQRVPEADEERQTRQLAHRIIYNMAVGK